MTTRTCLFCVQELDEDNPTPFCDDVCRMRAAEVKGYTDAQLATVNGYHPNRVWGRIPRPRAGRTNTFKH